MNSLLRFRRQQPAPAAGASSSALSLSSSKQDSSSCPGPTCSSGSVSDNNNNTPEGISTTKPTLMTLPPELHLLISRQLIYPDALSLKHTSRYFYYTVDTGVNLKVDWLLQRRRLHLDCPNNKKCELGSDLRFCRGSVRLLMQRRREHMECESRPGLGCLVYGTSVCTHRRTWGERWKQWMRRRLTIELWWLLLALVPLVLAWLWLTGMQ